MIFDYKFTTPEKFMITVRGRRFVGELVEGLRVEPASIPGGTRLYYLGHSEDDIGAPVIISPKSRVKNFFGCFICKENIGITSVSAIEHYYFI